VPATKKQPRTQSALTTAVPARPCSPVSRDPDAVFLTDGQADLGKLSHAKAAYESRIVQLQAELAELDLRYAKSRSVQSRSDLPKRRVQPSKAEAEAFGEMRHGRGVECGMALQEERRRGELTQQKSRATITRQ
jgi:hypothetical protein